MVNFKPVLDNTENCSFVVSFEIGLTNFVLLFPDCFGLLVFLHFHTDFRISLSVAGWKGGWNFDRDYVASIDLFEKYFHFNNIKSLIHSMECLSI